MRREKPKAMVDTVKESHNYLIGFYLITSKIVVSLLYYLLFPFSSIASSFVFPT